jgi:hypothetical protein
MQNRTAILLAIGVGGMGLVIGLLVSRSSVQAALEEARAAARMANEAAASREKAIAQEPPVLERPDNRVPALTESPKAPEPPIATSSPVAPATPAPSQHESLGDETTWPSEYANKPLADLIADEARLMEEFKKDLDAEFEKRFKDGRCETRPYDLQSLLGKKTISGAYRGRKVGDTYQSVLLDPRVEPDLFIKEDKASWISGEIIRRQR